MTLRLSALALAPLAIASCGGFYMLESEPPGEIKPQDGKAALVIYRGTSYGAAMRIDNYLDGTFIGQTKGKSYFITPVDPGEHIVLADAENNACAKITFEEGKTYYLLQAIYPGIMAARTGFSASNPDKFADDYKSLDYYECCTEGELPVIDPEDYAETVADHEKELEEDPGRHEDTSNLQGY